MTFLRYTDRIWRMFNQPILKGDNDNDIQSKAKGKGR